MYVYVCIQAAVYPLEVFRTQLATAPPGMYRGAVDCARHVYKRSGVAGFYRGICPSMVRPPHCTCCPKGIVREACARFGCTATARTRVRAAAAAAS
jgi:Mitochondrial carrier protein